MPRPAKKTGDLRLLRPVRHRGLTYRPNREGHLEAFISTRPTDEELAAYRETRSVEGALPAAPPKAAPPSGAPPSGAPEPDAEPES